MKRFCNAIIATFVLVAISASVSAKSYRVSQDKMLDRLLGYIKINSQSQYDKENSSIFTMTDGQRVMAQHLANEAKALGAKVYVCPDNYVYIELPSNTKADVPTLGISCHYDTTPEAPCSKVINPIVIKYKGGDIIQGEGRSISPDSHFGRDLKNHIGKTIIHTDGTTLLGGDDKNGCAITMSVLETLLKNGKKQRHGKVQFVFCPNEDIGLSAARIDKAYFNPDILYDMDGEGGNEITISNFTARGFDVCFTGNKAHPAEAKKMKFGDALAAASTFIAAVPVKYRPENSEGRQGYIHPYTMSADSTETIYKVSTRIRYFDRAEGDIFDKIINEAVARIKRDFPNVKTEVVYDGLQYENVEYSMHPKSRAIVAEAAKRAGIAYKEVDGRGGTTASMFCAKGLKGGMNVFTGQYAVHSTNEYAVLEEIYAAYRLMMEIVGQVAATE